MSKVGRKRKEQRNQIIVEKREEDPEKHTFQVLADMFNITRGRACQIYHRYKNEK